MDEREANIRESLLKTLSFLASETQQREFATQVFYQSYQGEWACWWFDEFISDDPDAPNMFTPSQLFLMKDFSKDFDNALGKIGIARHLTIDQLQAMPEWQALITKAEETSARLERSE